MLRCVDLAVYGSEEIFEVCCIANGIQVHLEYTEEVEEEADVEDCILLMDVSFEGEEGGGHLEGKLVVGEIEPASQRKQMLAQIVVDPADTLLYWLLLLHLAAVLLLHTLLHRSRLLLQHHFLLGFFIHLDLLLLRSALLRRLLLLRVGRADVMQKMGTFC